MFIFGYMFQYRVYIVLIGVIGMIASCQFDADLALNPKETGEGYIQLNYDKVLYKNQLVIDSIYLENDGFIVSYIRGDNYSHNTYFTNPKYLKAGSYQNYILNGDDYHNYDTIKLISLTLHSDKGVPGEFEYTMENPIDMPLTKPNYYPNYKPFLYRTSEGVHLPKVKFKSINYFRQPNQLSVKLTTLHSPAFLAVYTEKDGGIDWSNRIGVSKLQSSKYFEEYEKIVETNHLINDQQYVYIVLHEDVDSNGELDFEPNNLGPDSIAYYFNDGERRLLIDSFYFERN